MPLFRVPGWRHAVIAAVAGLAFAVQSGIAEEAERAAPYTIAVEAAAGPVGEPTAVKVVVTLDDGYRFSGHYNNRIKKISAQEGVAFDDTLVPGEVVGDELHFVIPATPTAPGAHVINGIVRFSYIHDDRIDMKSEPLITTVTGQ